MTDHPTAPWNVRDAEYPATGTDSDKLRFLVRYAVLAPSSHNTQPWLFRIDDHHLDVIADRSRALPVVDPHDRELVISCGAAIGVLRIALYHFGHRGQIELLPASDDPDLLARIRLGPSHEPSAADHARFAAITKRRSTRRSFEDKPLPPGIADELIGIARAEDCDLVIITDPTGKSSVAELVADADKIQYDDPEFRRELAEWVKSRDSSSHDGMSLASYGAPDILSGVGSLVIRTFDVGGGVAANDAKVATDSPALVVLSTRSDKPGDWLVAGITHVTVLLAVTASGLTADYLNQPIEVEGLRPRLKNLIGTSGIPQLLFRIGRGPEIEPAVRRPVEEVIIT